MILDRTFSSPSTPIIHDQCMRQVDNAIIDACDGYTDYSRKYAKVVINTCRMAVDMGVSVEIASKELVAVMDSLCKDRPTSME